MKKDKFMKDKIIQYLKKIILLRINYLKKINHEKVIVFNCTFATDFSF